MMLDCLQCLLMHKQCRHAWRQPTELLASAQVLMVVFDLMASAQRMAAWLEGALDAQMLAASKLRAAKRLCHRRISETHMPLKQVHSDGVAAGIAPLLEQTTSPTPVQLDPGSGAVVSHAGMLACCMLQEKTS